MATVAAPSRGAKLARACIVALVGTCFIFAGLEYKSNGGYYYSLSSTSSSLTSSLFVGYDNMVPLSLTYQPKSPFKGSMRKELSTATRSDETGGAVGPVQVLVCVEALCIDSQSFFHDQLMIAFNALDHTVMNLTVVSFGNAKLPSDDSHNITCQHGVGECDANAYEQCAVHLYPDPAQHVPYLACLFAALPMGHRDDPFAQWTGLEPCAHSHHLDFGLLKQCHDDANLSWKLQQEAAKATPARHDHVPWVEINGMPMDEESTTLLREVCHVYEQAGGHAAGCSSDS